jgi:hypothetical protein
MREIGDKLRIFISYSHNDKIWLDRLKVHLKPLIRDYNLEIWDDTEIDVGEEWFAKIEEALKTSRVSILLISADFLASEFINKEELPKIFKNLEESGSSILPIIIGPSLFSSHRILSKFQTVNSPSEPLINLEKGEQEAIFAKVAEHLEIVAKRNELRKVKEVEERQENTEKMVDAVRIALEGIVTKYEREHLKKLLPQNDDIVRFGPHFFSEIERLDAIGFIAPLKDSGIVAIKKEHGNPGEELHLREYVTLTKKGTIYLKIVGDIN